jgi:pilus assembly protein CpaC
LREAVSKFPVLGDLPVIGALFRSQDFINRESELVILVTPRLAKPLAPGDIRLPTDKFVKPSDSDFYLMGKMEGRAAASATPTAATTGGTDGSYGHRID